MAVEQTRSEFSGLDFRFFILRLGELEGALQLTISSRLLYEP